MLRPVTVYGMLQKTQYGQMPQCVVGRVLTYSLVLDVGKLIREFSDEALNWQAILDGTVDFVRVIRGTVS
jgi:hypothetical protein